jgi:hypothetical protein
MGFDPISWGVALADTGSLSAASAAATTATTSAAEAAAITDTGANFGADAFASSPSWLSSLAYTGTAAQVGGGIAGAIGSERTAAAEAEAAKYQAAVNAQNAKQQQQNAQVAEQAGAAQVGMVGQRTKSEVGAIMANQGASGVDTYSGSALDVRSSAKALGELSALTTRSNADRQAYGYSVQGTSDLAQSTLDKQQAKYAQESGNISAATSFLGGVGGAASNWAKYQQQSGSDLGVFS